MDELLSNDNEESSQNHFLDVVIDASAAAAGVGVEHLLGGSTGALIATAFGPGISKLLRLVFPHHGSDREKKRVLNVLTIAALRIEERRADGEQPQSGDAAELREADESTAKELLEGLVLSAQREYERKKLFPLGRFVGSLVFETHISPSYINALIHLTSSLTYTQLCLLAIFQNTDEWNLRSRSYYDSDEPNDGTIGFSNDLGDVLYQTFDLWQRGLIYLRHSEGEPHRLPNASLIIPSRMTTHSAGEHLAILMELDLVDQSELSWIAELLRE